VLASASPRRRELLDSLGLRFTVRAAEVDESPRPGEEAEEQVLRLAKEKAAAQSRAGEVALGADTLVVLGAEVLGKPRDRADARRMLGLIAGREHTVLTGVALHERPRPGSEPDGRRARPSSQGGVFAGQGVPDQAAGGSVAAVASSRVRMAPMSEEEIAWYVATGEPLDKAGSYAVQGLGAVFVEAVFGNYTNVVGLPLPATYRLFSALGYDLRRWINRRT
jgi:septum formation protein